MLRERGERLIATLSRHFPAAMPEPGGVLLEIGSGVGYLMEAASRKFQPARIIGLDIAPAMIEKAKERLARDAVDIPAEFMSYDGISVPIADHSVDYIYSVACLQHIPKPYVYNLFGEMLRVLRSRAYATLHFLSFAALTVPGKKMNLRLEIAQQLAGAEGHWHHFYTREELLQVLTHGYDASGVSVVEAEGALWAAFTNKSFQDMPSTLSNLPTSVG